jgi:hypothetical protein
VFGAPERRSRTFHDKNELYYFIWSNELYYTELAPLFSFYVQYINYRQTGTLIYRITGRLILHYYHYYTYPCWISNWTSWIPIGYEFGYPTDSLALSYMYVYVAWSP